MSQFVRFVLDPKKMISVFGKKLRSIAPIPTLLGSKLSPKVLRRKIAIKYFSIRPTYTSAQETTLSKIPGAEVTVVLPVYGQIQIVRHLFKQLQKEQISFPFKLIVIDDAYDAISSQWLKRRMSNWAESKLIVNPVNMGYLRSINIAVNQATTKYCVLLNSDIEINSNTIERISSSLAETDVALATALATDSGANLSIEIPKGRHWIEVDNWLAGLKPVYPDAHTAIGYAMAVNLDLLDRTELFSQDFKDGYGEDSDLHFRALEKGYRSVIADNVLVRHHSGMSYRTKEDMSTTKEINADTFKRKWGRLYLRRLRRWESRNPVHKIEGFIRQSHISKEVSADFLILIPSLDDDSGGSKMVVALFEQLWREGRTARLLSTIRDIYRHSAWSPVSDWQLKGSNYPNVITTGSGTFEKGTRLSSMFKANRILFFQGPEMFFDSGEYFGRTVNHVAESDLTICNSPFLEELAQQFGAKNTCVVPLGPDTDVYFRDEKIHKTNKVLVSSRLNSDKATVLSIPLAMSFLKLGYNVETFGFPIKALTLVPGIRHHGHLDPFAMNRLMNEATYLIDTSLFEGLGLTPLEAVRAQCVPLVTKKGGLESVNPPSNWMAWIDSPFITHEDLSQVIRASERSRNQSLSELDEFFTRINLDSGISKAVEYLGGY
jgi:GT2 family glycosyltransferase